MTIQTLSLPASPATLEQRAFANLVPVKGVVRIRAALGDVIEGRQADVIHPTVREVRTAIQAAEGAEGFFRELRHLLKAGITREQLLDLCQWGETEAGRVADEQQHLLADVQGI